MNRSRAIAPFIQHRPPMKWTNRALALLGVSTDDDVARELARLSVDADPVRRQTLEGLLTALTTFGQMQYGRGIAADREAAAALHASEDLHFIEVYVNAPLALCEKRDPKGLYARARAGELTGLTGVGAPYEPPSQPDVLLGAGEETVESEVQRVLEALIARGLIPF